MKIAYVVHGLGERVFDTLDEWLVFCFRMAYTWFGLPHSWLCCLQNNQLIPRDSHLIFPYLIDEHGPRTLPITFEELQDKFIVTNKQGDEENEVF